MVGSYFLPTTLVYGVGGGGGGWVGGLNSANHEGAEGAKEKKWETTMTTVRLFIRLPHRVETAGSRRTLPTSQRPNNNAALVSQ